MSKRTYRALLIANSTFPNDPHNLPDLEGPRNDPMLLRDALCDDRYGLFRIDNVRLVTGRTAAKVLEETEDFLHSADRQDTLLLYYSGHGRLDIANELYLCASNSRVDRLRSTAVMGSHLSTMIEASAAGTTVVVLDCCHSGAFKGGDLAERLTGQGRFVLTSCRTGELANDADAVNRASMFTHHLVQGMLGGATDHDGDGFVNLEELYRYVHDRLTVERRQIPEKSFAGSGDVPMARRAFRADALASAGVVDLSTTEPILYVVPMKIEIDNVKAGEDLPPERIAVVNRGGGELTWSVECRAKWMTLERDEHGLLLHLEPGPGANRANIEIRDGHSGLTKTVRLVVRVSTPEPLASARRPVLREIPFQLATGRGKQGTIQDVRHGLVDRIDGAQLEHAVGEDAAGASADVHGELRHGNERKRGVKRSSPRAWFIRAFHRLDLWHVSRRRLIVGFCGLTSLIIAGIQVRDLVSTRTREETPKTSESTFPVHGGLTIDETVRHLSDPENGGKFEKDGLRKALDEGLVTSKHFDSGELESLEGMLYPSTYSMDDDTTEVEFLQMMVDEFDKVYEDLDVEARASEVGFESGYEVLTVASMVEQEARIDEDRGKIARVVYNRLEADRALQIDATSCYDKEGQCFPLSDEDLRGPYSTRHDPGLPPTPIGSPGRASIEAALEPAEGDWLYYVLDVEADDGSHFFTDDDQEWEPYRERCEDAGLCG